MAYSHAIQGGLSDAHSAFRGSSATFINLPDLDYSRTLLARSLGDGEVLFPGWRTDLAPLQHLLRVACAGVDLGISGARQLARLSAANRPAAGTSCQFAANGRQHRDARRLSDRNQGRFYLARFPFQFRALFLPGVTFFASLSAALSGPPVF